MKTVDLRRYVCERCGEMYETERECSKCEASHRVSLVRLSLDADTGDMRMTVSREKDSGQGRMLVDRRTSISKVSPMKVTMDWSCYVPEGKETVGRKLVKDACGAWLGGKAEEVARRRLRAHEMPRGGRKPKA